MDSQWLRTQFSLNPDKTKADLARALGLEPPAISKIIAGTRQIKAHEYVAMRRFFDLPVDGERAARGGGADKSYVIKPLAPSGLGERAGATADTDNAWIMPASLFAHRRKTTPESVKIFAVQESAMAPALLPGEHVLVDMADTTPSPPGLFVVSDGQGYMIRQCAHVPHSTPPEIRLSAGDPQYESLTLPAARAGLIGRIIAKLQWL